jgi:hypothetical protein
MKQISTLLIAIGLAVTIWSAYIFIKYLGLGGDNSLTPYTGLFGISLLLTGIILHKK